MKEVIVKFIKNYQHEAKTKQHSIIIDEAKDVGGDGKGPDPYDLLLSALGGCTSMTLMMYAKLMPVIVMSVKRRRENLTRLPKPSSCGGISLRSREKGFLRLHNGVRSTGR